VGPTPLVTLLRGNDFDTGLFSVRRQHLLLSALRSSARVCVVARNTGEYVAAVAPETPVSWVANSIAGDGWEVLPSERRQATRWREAQVISGRRTLGLIGHLKHRRGWGCS
jgi:hypothetical protein